jgi:hypothetical protein
MAASDKKLGDLHEAVADALSEQVKGYTKTEVTAAGEEVQVEVKASPALLSAAIAFLKNNNITADAEDNAALRDLNQALQARRKKKIPQASLDEAADTFASRFGDAGMMQ